MQKDLKKRVQLFFCSIPSRGEVDWHTLSDEDLMLAYLLVDDANLVQALHGEVFDAATVKEIQDEILSRPQLLDTLAEQTPVTHAEDVPAIFHVWPFSLLWKQRQP